MMAFGCAVSCVLYLCAILLITPFGPGVTVVLVGLSVIIVILRRALRSDWPLY